jgi:hypothetical protein
LTKSSIISKKGKIAQDWNDAFITKYIEELVILTTYKWHPTQEWERHPKVLNPPLSTLKEKNLS